MLNGERMTRSRPLKMGDLVTAGKLTMEFRGGGAVEEKQKTGQDVVFTDGGGQDERSATVAIRLDGVLGGTTVIGAQKGGEKALASQMKALIQAGRELADHRPLDELFALILDLAAKAVGSTRGVLILQEDATLAVKAAIGKSFEISRTVRDRVLEDKESLLIRDVEFDEQLRMQASIVAQSIKSIIAVPLQAKEKVIGLIYLDSPHWVRPFTVEDLGLLTVMANIAAIRIENARLTEVEHHERLMAREMSQAAEIQRSLLPRVVPQHAGLDIAAFSVPCLSVGGDHYDFYERDGKVILVVADVAGKGLPAALLMASLQARIQVLVEVEDDLASLVTRLNRTISSNCPGNRFITFFLCQVDVASGEMQYVNAGHNPPMVVRRDGTVDHLEGGGMVLGIFGKAVYTQQAARLEEGDVLVMFSDGVTEAEDPKTEEDFGDERLAASLETGARRSLPEMIEQVKAAVRGFAGSVPAADDFTLVLARKGN